MVEGICAYVPQVSCFELGMICYSPGSRLRGSEMPPSKVPYFLPMTEVLLTACDLENILFSLPFDEERYQKTLEVLSVSQESSGYLSTLSRSVPWSAIWRFWKVGDSS